MRDRANDEYFIKAKKDGYRARSAYKLIEMQEKFGVIKKNGLVLDLGAAPGAWIQVASKFTNHIDAIDLLYIETLPNVRTLRANIFSPEARAFMDKKYDTILSDMAPNTSGERSHDHLAIMGLAEEVVHICIDHLQLGGSLCVKVFDGSEVIAFTKLLRERFDLVKRFKPRSSHSESPEFYFVCKGWRLQEA